MKRVLITGGAGFIGSHLAYRLVSGEWPVTILDDMSSGYRDNLKHAGRAFARPLVMDVREKAIYPRFRGVDCVVHLAGIAPLPECQADPGTAIDVNTAGTANVLEAARRAGVRRVIFASTSAIYERSPGPVHREGDPLRPNLVYAQSKLAAESLCRSFADNYGMDIVIVRLFNVYGAHQDALRKAPPFMSFLARELVMDRVPVLFNKSRAERDYLNVADLVDLLVRMIRSKKHYRADVFNAASGKAYSVPDLYAIMRRISGKAIAPRYDSPEKFWDRYPELFAGPYPLKRSRVRKEVFKRAHASNRKARREFEWEPRIGIEEGLRAVYEYSLNHKRLLRRLEEGSAG